MLSRDFWGLWYLFLLFGCFFGNAGKNNLETPALLTVLKAFKEFVEQDLLAEVQKLYNKFKAWFYFMGNLLLGSILTDTINLIQGRNF